MQGVVDRIENDFAVVLIKKSELPANIAEGSVLDLEVKNNLKETKKRKRQVRKNLTELF